jgi:hypothetical protein
MIFGMLLGPVWLILEEPPSGSSIVFIMEMLFKKRDV